MRLIRPEFDEIPSYWPEISAWVERALRVSIAYAPDDILHALVVGQMQLWIAEDSEVRGCAVTQVVNYPRAKVCHILIVGGRRMVDWLHYDSEIEKWANEIGCKAIEGPGRRGWERAARPLGYKQVYGIFRKDIR